MHNLPRKMANCIEYSSRFPVKFFNRRCTAVKLLSCFCLILKVKTKPDKNRPSFLTTNFFRVETFNLQYCLFFFVMANSPGLNKNAYHTFLINAKFIFIIHRYRKLYEKSMINNFPVVFSTEHEWQRPWLLNASKVGGSCIYNA